MSGFTGGQNTAESGNQFAEIVLQGRVGSALSRILLAEALTPGDQPSYELAKLLYAFHPLGAKMAEAPINMAQSQERLITIPVPGEEKLIGEFRRTWNVLGEGAGADALIKSVKMQSRIYGIASISMGDRNAPDDTNKEVDWTRLHETKPYFSTFDPLNTAGSLILDQNPQSPDFQKPTAVRVGGKTFHRSRTVVVINEAPLYILWSDAAFGFSGRSVYQRALFPLKTFLQSLITDWLVTVKCGLLVHKAKAPGSMQNNRVLQFFGFKRSQLKGGVTGQVLTIDTAEDIMSLNFQNLEGPAMMARNNSLKAIAMAASMPAKLLEQEELVEGLAEGTEDAKQIARYIDRIRIEMNPIYDFFDRVTQRLAWTPDFYKIMQRLYPEDYPASMPYETAFNGWMNAFTPKWPNLLAEPESKEFETEKIRFESAVAVVEVAAPLIRDSENRAALLAWLADEVNSRRKLFAAPLILDEEAEAAIETMPPIAQETQEPTTPPFAARA